MRNISKWTIEFYNKMSGSTAKDISDIPPDALQMLSYMRYDHILYPFVGKYIESGKSSGQAAMKFDISVHKVRQIGRDIGLYKVRPTDKKR